MSIRADWRSEGREQNRHGHASALLSSGRRAGIVRGIRRCPDQSRAMRNPVLIELTRGTLVESAHTGAIALARSTGELVGAVGNVLTPVFPRSAIKPLQAIAFLERGAADRF